MNDFPTCRVHTIVRNPDGTPVIGALVLAQLSKPLTYHGTIIPQRITARSDGKGYVSLDLFPNLAVADPKTYYQIIIYTGEAKNVTFNIMVPEDAEHELRSLIIREVPAEIKDPAEAAMVRLAEIEENVHRDAKEVDADLNFIKDLVTKSENVEDTIQDLVRQAVDAKTEAEKAEKDAQASLTSSQAIETEIAKDATSAEEAEKSAKSSALTAQIASSDASNHEDATEQLLKSAQTIKADIDHIYAQILASLKPGSSQTSLSVVMRETFIYKATAGQTVFQGNDIFGNNLSYTAGRVSIYFDGLMLLQTEDYIATDGVKVTLTKPAKKGDWMGIMVFEEAGGGGGGTIEDVQGLQAALDSKYSDENLPQISNVVGLPEILGYVDIPPGPGGRKPIISNDIYIYDNDFNQLRPRAVKNLNEFVFYYSPDNKGIGTNAKKFRLSFPAWYTKINMLFKFTIIGNGQDGDTPANRNNTLGGRGADVIIHHHLRLANPKFQVPEGTTINDYIVDDLYIIDLEDPEECASLIVNHMDIWPLAYPVTAVDGSVNWVDQNKSIKILAYNGAAQKTDQERQAKVPAQYTMFYLGATGGGIDIAFSTSGTGGGGSGGYPGGGSTTAIGGHGGHGWGGGGAAGGDLNKSDPKGSSGMSHLWQYRQPEFGTSSTVIEDGDNGLFGGGGGGAGQNGTPGKGGGSIVILEIFLLVIGAKL